MTSPLLTLASTLPAWLRYEIQRHSLMLVRVALLFCITLILVAVMSFGWTIEDSNSQLQNSEDSSGVKSSALPSINKLAKFEPVKFDVAKHIGTNSGAGALLLNAHAASAPFTGTP